MGRQRQAIRFITGILASIATLVLALNFSPPANAAISQSRDCDDNAIIRCGALSEAELKTKYRENQQGNVHRIFSESGIANEQAMTGLVEGRVMRDGRVMVGNTVVATNAQTVGRTNMPGSTPIADGAAYRRPPSVSFSEGVNELSALVKMDGNNRFMFAVLTACGNPVTGQPSQPPPPPPTPNFQITKDVRARGQTTWQQNVRVRPGDLVEYRITIRNTGQTDLTHVRFRDRLPAGIGYVANTLRVDGRANTGAFLGNGIDLGTIRRNASVVITFTGRVSQQADACNTTGLNNLAFARPENLPEKQDNATVQVCREQQPPPPPPERPVEQPEQPTPTPVVQAAVTPELPKTGAEAIAGAFAATVSGGTLAHMLMAPLRRRLLG